MESGRDDANLLHWDWIEFDPNWHGEQPAADCSDSYLDWYIRGDLPPSRSCHGCEREKKTGIPLAINGMFGNMGVACAALLTGLLIDTTGWRSAFIVSGLVSICVGVLYVHYHLTIFA